MARSVLLQIARDAIEEVLQMQQKIDKDALLKEYILLKEPVVTTVKIYLNGELRGMHKDSNNNSLLEAIINAARKAAFEDTNFTPLLVSQYLRCEIEIILETDKGEIREKDSPLTTF